MGRKLPPFSAIRAFEAAARLHSFKAASEELCVTQSAISHQIKALEQFLNSENIGSFTDTSLDLLLRQFAKFQAECHIVVN